MKNEKLIKDILKEGESQVLEYKASVRKEDVARVLCGFLNGEGGRLLIGVEDNGTPIGVEKPDEKLNDLKLFLQDAIVPDAPITMGIEQVEDKPLLLFKVYKGSKQPYLFDGSIYYRKGNRTVKATSKQISDLIYGRQKAEQHWERQPALGITLDDLDEKLIRATMKESTANHRGSFTGNDVLDFLAHYGLYLNGSFTNACVVLFAKSPARYIPQIRVRLTEYGDGKTADSLLRDEVYEGNLFDIRDKLERYVGNMGIRSVFDKNQWKRVDFKFPEKALQEGIINALMHRDYSVPSSGMTISIYPDRFVISNSGNLPPELKPGDLKRDHRSHPLNPDIAHVVFLRGLIDKLGRGTVRIVALCKDEGLKEPVWKDDKEGVTLTFYGPRALTAKKALRENDGVSDGVSDGVKAVANAIDDGVSKGVIDGVSDGVKAELIKITEVLDAREGLNAQEVADAIAKSKPTIERYLRMARKLGIIEFKGAPRTGGYYLVNLLKKE